MVRAGLRALLQSEAGTSIVGEAADGRTVVKMAADLAPDVIVMDISMPELNGVEATRQVMADGHGTKVIALSGHSDSQFVQEMLRAGATGYVPKEAAFEELTIALRTVVANKVYLSPRVTGVAVNEIVRPHTIDGKSIFTSLSSREREVLQLIAEGISTKRAAMQLHVSVKTIETHRRNIMDKLGLDSVAQLTKYAIRQGITSLDA